MDKREHSSNLTIYTKIIIYKDYLIRLSNIIKLRLITIFNISKFLNKITATVSKRITPLSRAIMLKNINFTNAINKAQIDYLIITKRKSNFRGQFLMANANQMLL